MQKEYKDNKEIGKLLQEARERHHYSQQDMVEEAGLSKNHISAVERGVSRASVSMLMGYCRKMKITPNDILCPEEQKKETLPEITRLLSKLSEEDQEKAYDILRVVFRD